MNCLGSPICSQRHHEIGRYDDMITISMTWWPGMGGVEGFSLLTNPISSAFLVAGIEEGEGFPYTHLFYFLSLQGFLSLLCPWYWERGGFSILTNPNSSVFPFSLSLVLGEGSVFPTHQSCLLLLPFPVPGFGLGIRRGESTDTQPCNMRTLTLKHETAGH